MADFAWFREQVDALFAQPDAKAGDALQLMTIHKAKGLEFDTVIIPGLGEVPRQDESSLILWLEQSGELLLAPISETGADADPIYDYLSSVERRKLEQETKRLLYVAATRARSALHLLGVMKMKEDGSIAEPASASFLKLLWPVVGQEFASLPPPKTVEEAVPPRTIRRVPADWAVPPPPPSVTWTHRKIEVVESPPLTYEWVGDALRHAGTALHGLLERIAREGVGAWNPETVRSRRPLYEAMLANLGVPPANLSEAAERVEKALLQTLRDPKGRWILAKHAEAECELTITGLVDGKLCEAVIDRTFVDEDGVRWIIDYKMSAHTGGDLETFLDNEKQRHEDQLLRYARLMNRESDGPIRLALYFPLLGGWREWAAPLVLTKQASLFEL